MICLGLATVFTPTVFFIKKQVMYDHVSRPDARYKSGYKTEIVKKKGRDVVKVPATDDEKKIKRMIGVVFLLLGTAIIIMNICEYKALKRDLQSTPTEEAMQIEDKSIEAADVVSVK